MKDKELILIIIGSIIGIALSAFFAYKVVSSDLPLWLKFLLLR